MLSQQCRAVEEYPLAAAWFINFTSYTISIFVYIPGVTLPAELQPCDWAIDFVWYHPVSLSSCGGARSNKFQQDQQQPGPHWPGTAHMRSSPDALTRTLPPAAAPGRPADASPEQPQTALTA